MFSYIVEQLSQSVAVNEADTALGSVVWGVFCRVIVCDSVGMYLHCAPYLCVSPMISVSVPLCAVVLPCQAGLLLQRVHPRQPSADLLHHAACATQFGAARTAAAGSREG